MKVKAFIALSLALVMLATLTVPALAKPAKSTLNMEGLDPAGASGKVTLRPTRDNNLMVTIVLRDAMPDTTYNVRLEFTYYPGTYVQVGQFQTSSGGDARYKNLAIWPFSGGNQYFDVLVESPNAGDPLRFSAEALLVVFR